MQMDEIAFVDLISIGNIKDEMQNLVDVELYLKFLESLCALFAHFDGLWLFWLLFWFVLWLDWLCYLYGCILVAWLFIPVFIKAFPFHYYDKISMNGNSIK